jgi:hypothetical protein
MYRDILFLNHFGDGALFPGEAYDRWKTQEPVMPSVADVCTPVQDGEAYALWAEMRDYRLKYGKQALQTLMDEALA